MPFLVVLWLAFAGLFLPVAARAAAPVPVADAALACPPTLAQAPLPERVPAGWVMHAAAGELPLQRVAFYDGDPVGLGPLMPDATQRHGPLETSTWRFEGGDSARVWLGCLYRDATAVVARPLPPGLRQCTSTLRLTPMGDPAGAVSVQCR